MGERIPESKAEQSVKGGKMNTFYHGDCLFVMNHDIEPNSVDLIYLDPPFFTGKVQKGIAKWQPGAMEVSYEDSKKFWGDTEKVNAMRTKSPEWLRHIAQTRPDFASYLFYMMERLEACHKVLRDTGSIYLHCDDKASHYLKMIMDEVFGHQFYMNEVIWKRTTSHNDANKYGCVHDIILIYNKSSNKIWNTQYLPIDEEYIKTNYPYIDSATGKRYASSPPHGAGQGKALYFGDKLLEPPRGRHWAWEQETINEYIAKGIIYFNSKGNPRYKKFVNEVGIPVQDLWADFMALGSQAKERVGYPTQKPVALLERIINASSNKGDIVLDPFCGCGTAIIAAQKLGRKWIGIDTSKDAHQVSKDRYHQLTFDSTFGQEEPNYVERTLDDVLAIGKPTDFEKWVNHYFKAKKPSPDKGVDGITPDNIPIQTKTFKVTYTYVSKLIADAKYHPQVKQPFDHAIIVSQTGFDDGARQRQFEIQTKESIKVDLLTPAMMLNNNGEVIL